jgi:hypothetical protein
MKRNEKDQEEEISELKKELTLGKDMTTAVLELVGKNQSTKEIFHAVNT